MKLLLNDECANDEHHGNGKLEDHKTIAEACSATGRNISFKNSYRIKSSEIECRIESRTKSNKHRETREQKYSGRILPDSWQQRCACYISECYQKDLSEQQ